ncbi:DNRLRE domain-containing protein, partial [Paenibacillus sp. TAF58]
IGTTPVGGAGTWYEWDVTSYLQAQTADKNVSFSLVMTSVTSSDNKVFDSMEGTNKPRLEVTY